jgi:hypothetical protein
MATLPELKTALRNAHNAGDTKAAQRIANMIATEQALAIADSAGPAAPAPAPAQPQRQFIGQSIPQAITAPIELAATGLTGATTGVLGYGAGGVAGLLESIRNGTYGTSVGGNLMAQRAMEGLQRYTYQPRTELAQQALQTVGEAAEAAKLAPVPVTAVPQALAQGAVQQARTQFGGMRRSQGQMRELARTRQEGVDAVVEGGSLPLIHGSPSAGLALDSVQIVREGQKQGKQGRKYGGFYLSPVSDLASAEGYARMGDGTPTIYNVNIKEGTKVLQKEGDITRLSESYIQQLTNEGYGLVVGKDPRGRTEYVVIDKNAIESLQARPTQNVRRPAPTAPPGSVGAAATEQALQRVTTAEMMPVPFTGGSALTTGQASRDFAQLQFEKETAKLQEIGAPIRERVQNQSVTLLQNFDAMVDSMQPITLSKPEIGLATTTAIENKANIALKRISAEYQKAEEAGETEELVLMAPLATKLEDLNNMSGIVPLIAGLRAEAQRLGAVVTDESGMLVPQKFSINNAEILRQWVNQATAWKDSREAKFAKQLVMAIDDSTEPAGGEIYRRARKLRRQYTEEFENVGLTAALLGTKGKTTERKIALENVFDKVVRLSPVEEMNKVRATLISAGPDGKQAWADLKAKGIDFIRESSQTSARDELGNFVISPSALHKTIKAMDQTGKLEALYGKKQAQTLRDLSEIALDIYTAPPGAINMSNTGSAMMNALDTVLTYGLAGLPIPGKQVLLEATQYVRNRQTRARVKDALAGPKRDKNLSESSRQNFATTSVGATRQPQTTTPAIEAVVEANLPTQMALRTVAAGDTVDGRVVREEIPNTGSISASLENYEVLPGVREVPISAFDPEYVNKITMDRLDDRTRRLAQEIQQSREINPLIVVQDSEGMYVLEGGHRFDALVASGAKSLPAMVVIDLDDPPAQAAK